MENEMFSMFSITFCVLSCRNIDAIVILFLQTNLQRKKSFACAWLDLMRLIQIYYLLMNDWAPQKNIRLKIMKKTERQMWI